MDIAAIIQTMSLEDKIALCSGASFWETKKFEKYGIPSLFMCDGPHGLRKQDLAGGTDMLGINESRPATCFPSEVTMAGAWDENLLQEIGSAIGEEARAQGVGLVLGPGANLKRNPLCGRNFEYFSEDPYLTGKLAAGFIRGLESHGIGTSLKHFAANSQERNRFTSDSIMDERTLREMYLTGFEIAVKEGKPATVMCAYPKLSGIHCSDHKELLTDILRSEWGFDGMVITDWGAMNDRIEGFRAGCDLNMPGGSEYMEKDVLAAVKGGTLSTNAVDASATRVLELVFRAAETLQEKTECDYDAHHELSRKAAEQGAVLLKNEDSILPLRRDAKIAILGSMAEDIRYQGAGSSHINPTKLVQPAEVLHNTAEPEQADACIIFTGLPPAYESEGFDRDNMKMPDNQLQLIEDTARKNPNTVVVLLCGAPIECPWADKVKAILYMGLPGQAGAEAAANLLYGSVCPAGRLAESWPMRYEDCVSAPYFSKAKDALYSEGIYVGYRHYDTVDVPVRWGFGYGLSYTRFAYSDLRIEGSTVTLTITNVGDKAGAEVVQLYIQPPRGSENRPIRELKGFRKIFLQPGDRQTVRFTLTDRSFAVWHNGWQVQGGVYTVCVGDMRRELEVPGERFILSAPWQTLSYTPSPPVKGQFTMDNSVEEMQAHSLVMKIMYKAVESTIAKGFDGKKDYANPDFRMMMTSSVGGPLRSMQISGGLKGGLMSGLLEMANGHFFKGLWRMLRG